jgi:hypothetical protein
MKCTEQINMQSVIFVLSLGLLITSLSILFYFNLKIKKMRNIYNSSLLFSIASTVATAISSFFKNAEEIGSQSITIIQPAANDTVHLANDDSVTIKVLARDIANIKEIEMEVKSNSGVIFFSDKEDEIENQNYTCVEDFYLTGLTKKTRVTLCVAFKNEFKNWKKKTINFYVTP